MNSSSLARLEQVHPTLKAKILQLEELLAGEGIHICVVQGLRSWNEQNRLYAQGRTSPGSVVTNAIGGHSWHNFGLAVDCAILNSDSTVDWNPQHPAWIRMEQAGVSLGLTSGANWTRIVDAPHFQLTGQFPMAAPDDECRDVFKHAGMEAVWGEARV